MTGFELVRLFEITAPEVLCQASALLQQINGADAFLKVISQRLYMGEFQSLFGNVHASPHFGHGIVVQYRDKLTTLDERQAGVVADQAQAISIQAALIR